MSHATTSTSTYILHKYSKSHPSPHKPSSQASRRDASDYIVAWQHFTNPVLRLVLDVRKQANAKLDSMRLRIVWSMDAGETFETSSQKDVVFEDIDLLSLSFLPINSQQGAEMLPVKAVYRDAVVGIRYLHPVGNSSTPTYRRFQVTFMSSSEALSFINSVRLVCPCKANPAPTSNNATAQLEPGPQENPLHETAINSAEQCRQRTLTTGSEMTMPVIPLLNNTQYAPSASTTQRPTSSQNLSQRPEALPQQHRHPVTAEASSGNMSQSRIPTFECAETHQPTSNSSATFSGPNSGNMQQPEASTNDISGSTMLGGPLMESLADVTNLYDLSPSALARLVGEVIREDGFVTLLEKLSSLWEIRSFVGT